ncbi:hypothetical protein C6H88_01220 [Chlamydia muridarum str. Nigg]|jgi:hypothetical protein|uniref:Uncharacterized protein n=2 Tax=Chlamydia muridarum TaxID=83560 RepID=A0A069ZV39_CHLMR|nr:hypothetical protein [Chlamydia muridarum]AAF39104.1 conserved hypothetical protein [Chlamydia muridarum str. Nigg]AHH22624.1 hypothetical protein TAC_01230 [Chlamydia muridarum str. Nigg3 CMUT3-5]AHH23548.1 hypothetical protein Y015_01230 [Chlamydia muridarum str. Nigg CM972]AID37770.1 hypothetical protein BB17_01255 [Chlamydia muridarum str. Nigg 2 MCR]AIT90446.1 hypothetical protein NC80_01160 [Chlamydia muridarum]
MKNKIFELLNHLYSKQEKRLMTLGTSMVPELTTEDLLQPMDYDELEGNPSFRFEEGVLSGIGEVRAALYSFFSDQEDSMREEFSSDISLCKD